MKPKRKYQVIKAQPNHTAGVSVDGKDLLFGTKQNAMTVVDAGMAAEIDARYGRHGSEKPGEVVVVPVECMPEQGHKRTFTVPELPWKKEK